jgi:His/Glu/Gln/Arg/opine family amino acid ABC transporter permease subunit
MNWEIIIKWLPKLAQGATLTLELVAIAVIAGLLLAIPLGIARSSRLWWVRAFPYGYIFFFRGTPLLVQLFLVYYGLAQFDVAVPARSVLVRHRDHDPAHRGLHRRDPARSDSGDPAG